MARRLALGLALLLLAAGCGDAKNKTPDPSPGPTDVTVGTTGATTSPTGASGTSTSGAAQGNGGRPLPSTPAQARNEDRANAIEEAANGTPGVFAGVLLAPGPATAIVLDVRVGAGATPRAAALANLQQLLATQSGKTVTLNGPTALRGVGGGTHSANEIRTLAGTQGTPHRAGVAVVHVLYLAGRFESDGVLGVSVRGDTMAIFTDALDSSTSPFVTRDRLERAVTVHEMGHLLGLVDLYLDDNRDDAKHPGHSTNPNSVMYWAVETSLVGQVLSGPPPVDFDGADLEDLRRIHNGAPPA